MDPSLNVRFQALLALMAMTPGEGAAATSTLERTMVSDKAGYHCQLACWALVKANEEAAIRTFIGMLERQEKARGLALMALRYLGPRARAAVEQGVSPPLAAEFHLPSLEN